jgi:hypothetical protein
MGTIITDASPEYLAFIVSLFIFAEDLTVPVKFSLAFLPGTLNCTKFVMEGIIIGLPISVLPI